VVDVFILVAVLGLGADHLLDPGVPWIATTGHYPHDDVTVSKDADQPIVLFHRERTDVLESEGLSGLEHGLVSLDDLGSSSHDFRNFHRNLLAGLSIDTGLFWTASGSQGSSRSLECPLELDPAQSMEPEAHQSPPRRRAPPEPRQKIPDEAACIGRRWIV